MAAALRLSYEASRLVSNIYFRNKLVDAFLFVVQLDLVILNCVACLQDLEDDINDDNVCYVWQGMNRYILYSFRTNLISFILQVI